jgi:hypothetical protein
MNKNLELSSTNKKIRSFDESTVEIFNLFLYSDFWDTLYICYDLTCLFHTSTTLTTNTYTHVFYDGVTTRSCFIIVMNEKKNEQHGRKEREEK